MQLQILGLCRSSPLPTLSTSARTMTLIFLMLPVASLSALARQELELASRSIILMFPPVRHLAAWRWVRSTHRKSTSMPILPVWSMRLVSLAVSQLALKVPSLTRRELTRRRQLLLVLLYLTASLNMSARTLSKPFLMPRNTSTRPRALSVRPRARLITPKQRTPARRINPTPRLQALAR